MTLRYRVPGVRLVFITAIRHRDSSGWDAELSVGAARVLA
jgi:hypothetical protein